MNLSAFLTAQASKAVTLGFSVVVDCFADAPVVLLQ
jgi:hypothetical protein